MDEFSIIAKYFKPLAANFSGSLNLSDDAAIISPPENCELVITKDAISEGIHFIGNESPDLIAAKALRVNLSDLAAMGAQPICYFLALILPKNTSEEWLEKFAEGLKKTGDEFSIHLAGGDTTATNGSLSISITAIGSIPKGKALKRSGAQTGDDIYVSGTLGDSAFGLELLSCHPRKSGDLKPDIDSRLRGVERYLIPEPRIALGIHLRDIATSCMDISDGLAQDLEHICTASNVGAIIYTKQIPTTSNQQLTTALNGGDDYELLFTASPDKKSVIEQLSKSLQLPLTCIGKICHPVEREALAQDLPKLKNIHILNENGKEIELAKKGFSHF